LPEGLFRRNPAKFAALAGKSRAIQPVFFAYSALSCGRISAAFSQAREQAGHKADHLKS
jgi:hypothetical protein